MKKVTLNKDGTPRKTGSGRRKGATSFVNVTIADLEKFCGSASVIPVSRVWLEQMGANVATPVPQDILAKESIAQAVEEAKIEFTLHQ